MPPDHLVLEPCIAHLGDQIDGYLLAVAPGGQLRFVNRAWCARLGGDPEAYLGRSISDVVTPGTAARLQRSIDDLFAGGRGGPQQVQAQVVGPADEVVHLEGHLTRLVLDTAPLALAFFGERTVGTTPPPFSVPLDREVALTERQLAVLQLFASGHTTKQVAAVLDIAVKTVHNHLTTIYRVLDAQSLVQATMIAAKLGLVELAAPVSTGPVIVRP
jgi:DNA-binding NarL/FixJ family response regulator